MNNKDCGAICQSASYRLFYKNREHNSVSITTAVDPEIVTQIPEEVIGKLQENCNTLVKSNTAVCDYKSFKGNSTTYADMDEIVDLLLSQ